MPIISDKDSKQLVALNNKVIEDNLQYRKQWESDAKEVELSFMGNKFPVKDYNTKTGLYGEVRRSSKKTVNLNIIKRQWRAIANFLQNNEPQFLITRGAPDTKEEALVQYRETLKAIFDGGEEEGFYDTVMDETIHWGFHRGIVWTMLYYNPDTKQYEFRSFDPMDTYIDLEAQRLGYIKKFVSTYTKDKEELTKKYEKDTDGEPIDWTLVGTDKDPSLSDTKNSLLIEKGGTNYCVMREGYYLDPDGMLWQVLTTRGHALEKKEIGKLNMMPVTYFAPIFTPGESYPRSWFSDIVAIEKEINEIIQKLSMIIKTGGRFVYVRAGTVISKSTNNLLNSLGIEVLEVTGDQDIPQQAQLLTVSQADIEYLNLMMKQAEDEGGMKGDIMGNSSTGADASGRAIQALQAGSKNNIGVALNELNKYMNRLVRILVKCFKVFPAAEIFSEEFEAMLNTKNLSDDVKIKVSITGRDAFDELTQQLQAIDILNMIQKFNPDLRLPPKFITETMGVTNDIATHIQKELDAQEDPDLQIAEGQAKKLIQGIPVNVSETDNHEVFIAIFSEALKNVPPDSPAADALITAIKTHEAFLQAGPQQ